jgi:hypothetical protein
LSFTFPKVNEAEKIDCDTHCPQNGTQNELLEEDSLKVTESANSIHQGPTAKKETERSNEV